MSVFSSNMHTHVLLVLFFTWRLLLQLPVIKAGLKDPPKTSVMFRFQLGQEEILYLLTLTCRFLCSSSISRGSSDLLMALITKQQLQLLSSLQRHIVNDRRRMIPDYLLALVDPPTWLSLLSWRAQGLLSSWLLPPRGVSTAWGGSSRGSRLCASRWR